MLHILIENCYRHKLVKDTKCDEKEICRQAKMKPIVPITDISKEHFVS